MKHSHGIEHVDTRNFKIAFFLNFGFTIIEFVGGLFTNSVAIMSDAAHDLGDTISLGFAWYFQNLAKKDGDQKYTYGYRRYSVLGALITLLVLLIGCVFILSEAIPRLFNPQAVDAKGMFFLSILGIAVNLAAMMQLRKGQSLNEKVGALHLLEDVLGWIAVLIGSVVMYFYDLPIIDPILSIGIAILILVNVYKNIRLTLDIMLQRIPKNISIDALTEVILSEKEVRRVDDIHLWTLDGSYHIMTADLYFDRNKSLAEIEECTARIRKKLTDFNLIHVTFDSKPVGMQEF